MYTVEWHEPLRLEAAGPVSGRRFKSSSLLAVAHGLSIPRQQWATFFVPDTVEVLPSTQSVDQAAIAAWDLED